MVNDEFKNIKYLALGENGEFKRPAKKVGELPKHLVKETLKMIAEKLGVQKIYYGEPLYQTLGLTKNEGKNLKYFCLRGEDMPLTILDV